MQWVSNVIDVLHDKRIITLRPTQWKSRLIVSLILVIFSTAGVFITDIAPNFAWNYWCAIVPLFAILCIWLSWHVSKSHRIEGSTIWNEVLHWLALLCAVYIVSIFVHTGVISYLIGALFVLILLALVLFLAGVHFDGMFMLIGLFLGLLAIASAYFIKYLAIIAIPAAIIVGLLLVWRFLIKSKEER